MATNTSKEKHHNNKKAARETAKKVSDYRRSRQFPESSSLPRQMKLLAEGCMPYVKDRFACAVRAVRSALHTIAATLGKIQIPRGVQIGTFLTASVVLVIYAVLTMFYTTATTVSFNGVELATVASEEEAAAARMSVERSISDVVGYNYTLEDSAVSYSTGLTSLSDVEDGETLKDALNNQLNVVEHGYALYVNGEFIGATQTEGALEELLDQVAAPYRNENTVSIDFVENVEVRECDLPVEQFTNLAEVALLLTSTKEGEVTYTVKKGDCWSVIAQDHNMTNKELLALNPGYDIDKLQIGDELIISNAVPYLTCSPESVRFSTALLFRS